MKGPLPAVNWLAVVRVEGVAVAEVEVRHVAALDLVHSSPRAVLVTKAPSTTAGAHHHLVTIALQLSVPLRGSQPSEQE